MRQLHITKDAKKFWEQLAAKQFSQIGRKILSLMADPTPHDSIQLKGSPYFRSDVGEFRIVYTFDEKAVAISVISKRNDDQVYREVKSKR